jgi:hypothetical protein
LEEAFDLLALLTAESTTGGGEDLDAVVDRFVVGFICIGQFAQAMGDALAESAIC